jgi:hypothetical protein
MDSKSIRQVYTIEIMKKDQCNVEWKQGSGRVPQGGRIVAMLDKIIVKLEIGAYRGTDKLLCKEKMKMEWVFTSNCSDSDTN